MAVANECPAPSAAVARSDIAGLARAWIGTPYHHQASRQRVGVDCVGLVRGIFRSIYGREAENVPGYSSDWGEVAGRETLLDAASRHLVASDRSEPSVGDVVVFRMRRGAIAKHVGVMTSTETMVHAMERVGVVEVNLGMWWRRRIAGIFSFPGIED